MSTVQSEAAESPPIAAAAGGQARRKHWSHRENRVAYAMLVPGLLPYVAFALIPIGWLIRYSFFRWNGFTDPVFVGVDNYARVARDVEWWGSVINTLQFGFGRLIIEVPLAMLLAYVFYRGVRAGIVYRTVVFLPHVLSAAIIGIIFSFLLRDVGGPVNQVLGKFGIGPISFFGDAQNAMRSLIGTGVWANVGIIMLLFFAGMATVPRELLEAAEIDGAGHWASFRYILLPMLLPVARVVVLITIIGILRSFDLVKTLSDGGPNGATEVMFTYLYRYFFEPEAIPQIGYAAALGVVASIVIGIVSIAYLRVVRPAKS